MSLFSEKRPKKKKKPTSLKTNVGTLTIERNQTRGVHSILQTRKVKDLRNHLLNNKWHAFLSVIS